MENGHIIEGVTFTFDMDPDDLQDALRWLRIALLNPVVTVEALISRLEESLKTYAPQQ